MPNPISPEEKLFAEVTTAIEEMLAEVGTFGEDEWVKTKVEKLISIIKPYRPKSAHEEALLQSQIDRLNHALAKAKE